MINFENFRAGLLECLENLQETSSEFPEDSEMEEVFEELLSKPTLTAEDFVLILSGDWGGQVYAVVDADLVNTDKVAEVLEYIDAVCWGCNEGEGASIRFSPKGLVEIDGGVLGGMGGGGYIPGKLWIHSELEKKDLAGRIHQDLEIPSKAHAEPRTCCGQPITFGILEPICETCETPYWG